MIAIDRPLPRSENFAETRARFVETASRIMSQQPRDWPTIAAVARAMGMSRTSAYYYFHNRESLLAATSLWVMDQLIRCFDLPDIGSEVKFALEHQSAVRLLIDELLLPGPMGEKRASWNGLVAAARMALEAKFPSEQIDAEVHVAWLLAGAGLGACVLQNVSLPEQKPAQIIERFRREAHRLSKLCLPE